MTARSEGGVFTVTGGEDSSHLIINVMDYGADPASADNGPAFDAAVAATETARTGRYNTAQASLYIPPGNYTIKREWSIGALNVYGAGSWATTLSFPTDLGAGKYAIKGSTGFEPATLQGFRLQSGAITTTYGVAPVNMHGIRLPAGWRLKDCEIGGFNWGVHGYGDHWHIDNCRFGGSYYNVMWDDKNRTNKADQALTNSKFDRAARAHIGIGYGGLIGSCTLINNHFAFCPYFFYQFDDGTVAPDPVLAIGNIFIDQSMEGPGNGIFYCEGGYGRILDNYFLECGTDSGINVDVTDPAMPHDYAFVVKEIIGNHFDRGGLGSLYGTVGVVNPGTTVSNNKFIFGSLQELWNAYTGGRKWLGSGSVGSEAPNQFEILEGGIWGLVQEATGAVTGGDVLGQFYDGVHSRTGVRAWQTGDPVAGFALRSVNYVAGDGVPVVKRGRMRCNTTTGNFDVGGHPIIARPDGANNGKVKFAADYSDRPLVGTAHTAYGPTVVGLTIGGDIT